jgi:outer membrane protein TolC
MCYLIEQMYQMNIKTYKIILLLLLFGMPVFAQENLSLAQAIARCLQNNYQIKIAVANKEVASNNNTWGNAGKYPAITFVASEANNLINQVPVNPFALGGVLMTGNLNTQIDLGWTIFNGYRVSIQKNNLEKLTYLSEGNVQLVIQAQIQSLMMAYHLAIFEKEKLHLRQKVLQLSKHRLLYVEAKQAYGQANRFDYLQEKNGLLSDSSNLILQELSYKNALKNMNLFMGEAVNTQFLLTDTLHYSNKNFEYADLESKLLENNQLLKNQLLNEALLKTNTSLAKTQLYPSLTLNAGLNSNVNSLTGIRLSDSKYQSYEGKTAFGYSYGAYLNLNLRYTIFNGGQVKRNIQNALVQEKIASLTLQDLQISAKNSLSKSLEQYDFRKLLVNIAQENLATANLNIQMAEERYKNGLLNSVEIRTVQLNYLAIALNKLDAVLDVIEAETELLRLIGGIVTP